ncbi:hypothetical protein [Escherichia coli]|uniref:hypothetical protein n=1 Tax=Escherichia coli TaxID=562 RepID=UPI00259C78CF|nr:hypothetical protein [Escherichia coli]MDM5025494.1 hypothetical protein [Escherichia coli]
MAQVIAKLLPLQLLRGVGLEQRQHVHLARKSLVEAVNADQIPDLYGYALVQENDGLSCDRRDMVIKFSHLQ